MDQVVVSNFAHIIIEKLDWKLKKRDFSSLTLRSYTTGVTVVTLGRFYRVSLKKRSWENYPSDVDKKNYGTCFEHSKLD